MLEKKDDYYMVENINIVCLYSYKNVKKTMMSLICKGNLSNWGILIQTFYLFVFLFDEY